MKNSRCEYCDGIILFANVSESFNIRGEVFVVEDVPLGICSKCGEKYYPGRVLERIEKLAMKLSGRKKVRKVAIMSY